MSGATGRIFTIGASGTSAQRFFERLTRAGVRRVVDVRLRNTSQLAGFTKGPDLAWLLRTIAAIDYAHEPRLAPTAELLDGYKRATVSWSEYERRFVVLLEARGALAGVDPGRFGGACLLCSEPTADRCHRRLVAEAIAARAAGALVVEHL